MKRLSWMIRPGVDLAADGAEDLVVAQLDDVAERRRGQPQQQEGGRVAARDREAARHRIGQGRLARDYQRPAAAPERGAAAQQR